MPHKEIGVISSLEFSKVFKDERDFTLWLNENLNILGEKLNIDMIESNVEEPIGGYYCDISAFDSNSNRNIIIENQKGSTNHDHVGKILTYASGKDAGIIIWIAEKFRDEHKKALEWINEKSNPDFGISFFALELKMINIKDSLPAVDFDIIVRPDTWENKPPITETNKKYLNFFSKLVEAYSKIQSNFRRPKAQPCGWIAFGAGKAGLSYSWAFKSNRRFSVELYIGTGEKERNKQYFEELETNKDEINAKLSKIGELSWERLEDKKASRIAIYKNIKDYMTNLNEGDFPEIIEWGTATMKSFSGILSEYIHNLR